MPYSLRLILCLITYFQAPKVLAVWEAWAPVRRARDLAASVRWVEALMVLGVAEVPLEVVPLRERPAFFPLAAVERIRALVAVGRVFPWRVFPREELAAIQSPPAVFSFARIPQGTGIFP